MKHSATVAAFVLAGGLLLHAEPAPVTAEDLPKDAASVLGGAGGIVDDMQFSADGTLLTYKDPANFIGIVPVVDLAKGTLRFTAAVEKKSIYHYALSADGKRLAGGWGEKTQVWDVETGKPVYEAPGNMPRFTPDSKTLVVLRPDTGVLAVLDAGTGKALREIAGFKGQVFQLSTVGRRVVELGHNGVMKGEARIFDVDTGEKVLERSDFPGMLVRYVPCDNGDERAWGYTNDAVQLWNLKRQKFTRDHGRQDGKLRGGANGAPDWSADGQVLALPWGDGATLYGPDGAEVHIGGTAPPPQRPPRKNPRDTEPEDIWVAPLVTDVCFAPDGREVALLGPDGSASIWTAASGELVARFQCPRPDKEPGLTQGWWTPDSKRLVVAVVRGKVISWSRDAVVEAWKARAEKK